MHKSFYIKRTIRFRRWSRKRCAMFCSLGRVVTIGFVRKGIIEASLGKQQGIILSDACVWKECRFEREEEDSGGGLETLLEMTLLSLQPQRLAGEGNCCYKTKFGDLEMEWAHR